MKKIAIKGSGNIMIGGKIIELFISLGAINGENRDGNSINYYYINEINNITYDKLENIPKNFKVYNSIEEYYQNIPINYTDI